MDYFRRTDRADAVIFGALFLAFGAPLGFFGVRGLIMFLGGSREAPADPVAFLIGIGACIGLVVLTVRLWRGAKNHHRSNTGYLLPNSFLLLGSLTAIGGAAWMLAESRHYRGPVSDDLQIAGAGAIGVMGLILWWRRTVRRDQKQ